MRGWGWEPYCGGPEDQWRWREETRPKVPEAPPGHGAAPCGLSQEVLDATVVCVVPYIGVLAELRGLSDADAVDCIGCAPPLGARTGGGGGCGCGRRFTEWR